MSERDAGSALARETVVSRMRSVFLHADVGDNLLQVAQLMQLTRIRHLPVLASGALAGMVAHRDVLEVSLSPLDGVSAVERFEQLRTIPLARVMRSPVYSIAPEATLAEAADAMLRHKIGCLPVVVGTDKGLRVIGLITESDLLAAAYVPRIDPRTLETRRPRDVDASG